MQTNATKGSEFILVKLLTMLRADVSEQFEENNLFNPKAAILAIIDFQLMPNLKKIALCVCGGGGEVEFVFFC